MKTAAPALRQLLGELTEPPTDRCMRCGQPLHGRLQIVLADADQAFEACNSDRVCRDWATIAAAYAHRTSTGGVLIRRGKADIFRSGHMGFGGGWWYLSLQHLAKSVAAFTLVSLVCVGGHTWSIDGIPIGGLMSGVCVAITLGAQEWRWFQDNPAHLRHGFVFGGRSVHTCISRRRYVDDLAGASRCFCCRCVFEFTQHAFEIRLSAVSDLRGSTVRPGTWLDLDILIDQQQVRLLPKNTNRAWLYHGAPRERCTLSHCGPTTERVQSLKISGLSTDRPGPRGLL